VLLEAARGQRIMASDSPNMAASRSLRLETMQAEANHAEMQRRLGQLDEHYRAQEEAAFADFNAKLDVINAQFERQRADIAAQVQQSLPVSIEGVLREKRDLEIGLLRRAHEEQAGARRKQYEEEKRRYGVELYNCITALIDAGVSRRTQTSSSTIIINLRTYSIVYLAHHC